MNKRELRKACIARREQLTARDKHTALAAMLEQLFALPVVPGAMVLSYQAMEARNEVPASFFEEMLLEHFGAGGICYPAADFASGEMEAFLDDTMLQWHSPGFGLEQPLSGTHIAPDKLDLILVPLLAFDTQGHRLGYGKGFYDRYLARCRPDVCKVGLSWFMPEDQLPEIGLHDVPLNYCITPQSLYVF